MRGIAVWDGSGHAMAALEQVLPLFRPAAFSHIEVMMIVWPQSETAMWADILERQLVSDDLHRAAAEVSTAYADRLRTAVSSITEEVHVSIVNADAAEAVRTAIVEFRADIVFFLVGSVDAGSQVATSIEAVLRENTVPVSVLHAPARPPLTMKAVAIGQFGGLDELKEYDLPKPEPAADEVLIRVRASGVGIWDSKQRTGTFLAAMAEFPLILGEECAGDIERVGSSVTGLREGDGVYAYFVATHGSYAQYVAVKAECVARKPAGLSYLEAAAVPVVGITAHQSIVDEIKLEPNEWLFVAGGAGGVGSFAVQIAARLGARVIVSALTEDFAYLESLGVARANLIDYTHGDVAAAVRTITNGTGADAALDAAGGENWKQTIEAVKDGGRLAQMTGQPVTSDRNVSILTVLSKPSAKRLDILRDMFDTGQLTVRVERSFPLMQARDAQQAVEHHHRPGEIVLSVD